MIDALASEGHFADHIIPVWMALPPEMRGSFFAPFARDVPGMVVGRVTESDRPTLVASVGDLRRARHRRRRVAIMEHGCGQSFGGDPRTATQPSYAGGSGRDAELFLHPGEHPAARDRERYPKATVEVVGCAKLDSLPRRPAYSIGIQCDLWNDLVAAMRSPLPTQGRDGTKGLCVAHAIANARLPEPKGNLRQAIGPSPSTTGGDTFPDVLMPDLQSRDLLAMEHLTSAMSRCTSDSNLGCRGSAISADRQLDLRWLFDGTLQRNIGGSTTEGLHTLLIQTTMFGSVSLAIPCTTTKAGTNEPAARPVICTSFHWNCRICAETMTAEDAFRSQVRDLAHEYTVIGHGHPRILRRLSLWYRSMGIETVPSFAEVCRRADVYVNDASSTLFEFASTGRPVVVLNPKRYRRTVTHGLRFWEASTVGVNVEQGDDLVAAVRLALEDQPDQQAERERCLDMVYAFRSGAAQRAADALVRWAA